MHPWERDFRRRFEPRDGGYLYRPWEGGPGTIFAADEIEGFVANWRRVWLNPLFWAAAAALGVAAPLALLLSGGTYATAHAVILAAVANTVVVVALIHVVRAPANEAASRPLGAIQERERVRPLWMVVLGHGIWLLWMSSIVFNPDLHWIVRALAMAVLLYSLYSVIRGMLEWRRRAG